MPSFRPHSPGRRSSSRRASTGASTATASRSRGASPNPSFSFNNNHHNPKRQQKNHSFRTDGNQSGGHGRQIQRSLSTSMLSLSRMPSLRDHAEVRINDIVGNGISGILYKWVNYGRGWRLRWFVLQDGVLSYYKIHGPDKIVINQDTEKGSKIIGEESFRLISYPKRIPSQPLPCRKPCGEIHLKVSSIRESRSDERRFSIFTGTKRLHLRAETREDCVAWMEAFKAVKGMFPRLSNSELLVRAQTDNMDISTDKLRQRLSEEGVREAVIHESEQIMKKEFSSLHNQLLLLKQKQLLLIDTLRHLETEKVDLENTVVDETQRHLKFQDTSSGLQQDKYNEGSPSDSDDDNDKHDELEEETDDENDAFFDTQDFLSSGSVRSIGSEFARSSFDSEDEMDLDCGNGTDSCMRSVGMNYPLVRRRKKLPDPVEKETGVSLWSMIKDNIGKDLTKVCLPVYFNEPVSLLQKCFEDLEYSYLLDRAYEWGKMDVGMLLFPLPLVQNDCELFKYKPYPCITCIKGNSLMRILNVAAFAVSGYSSSEGRSCKPFNPLLGETYEADYPDKGLRFVSEKVSHHPMIVACCCEGRGWRFWGDSNLKSKFWGRSIQLNPVGVLTLEFDDGEVFQWSKVTTSIYNLILGKLYSDHYGTMHIKGNRDYSCKIKFKEQSMIDRNPHQVHGVVHDTSGKTVATLIGKWDESIRYFNGEVSGKGKGSDSSEAHLIWKKHRASRFPTRYNLTKFTITLNELTPGLKEKLPPTDSRLRPDQRYLENGEYEMANSEKLRLEQRQRQSRKIQERGWKPMWFRKQKGSDTYSYVGGYWEAREEGKWESCPDIFGQIPNDTDL